MSLSKTSLFLLAFIGKIVLSLRYKVVIRGDDKVKMRGIKQTLFLSTLASKLDPVFLFCWFWPRYKFRPVILEFVANLPFIGFVISLLKGVSVPDFETSVNQYKIKKRDAAGYKIGTDLKGGSNFILFPSGKLKNRGEERVDDRSLLHPLLDQVPEAQVVLIRISGLWGSLFSKAINGNSPNVLDALRLGLKILLKNGIFFAPRRKVYIDIKSFPEDFPRKESLGAVKQYVEGWFNQFSDDDKQIHNAEPLKLIPYYFWSKELPKANPPVILLNSAEIEEKIYAKIREILGRPDLAIKPQMLLNSDLGMDSLNIAEMLAQFSKNYPVQEVNFAELKKVEDLVQLALSAEEKMKRSISGRKEAEEKKARWSKEKKRPVAISIQGKTIQEAFLSICQKMGPFNAMADDTSGVITYKKCKKAALVLAEVFRKIPEKNVAILLPSSVGSALVMLALLLADKVPVPLNWTIGPKSLDYALSLTGIKKVVSSWKFMEAANFVDFGSAADQIELLEDIKRDIPLKAKLKGAFLALFPSSFLLKKFQISQIDENSTSIILFTSGSESVPKGVPLSHKNILANLRNSYLSLEGHLTPEDVFFGSIPHFHSYGITATFLPLLTGVRLALSPNPTDSAALSEEIERWQVTLFLTIPTFLSKILEVAKPEQLMSLRFVFTGGEKTPKELFAKVENIHKGIEILEGYGLTETSPIISGTQIGCARKGVGKLMPQVEAMIIHPETHEILPLGTQGEICVRGPIVFQGYLGNVASPFIELQGKSWFRTGDLGYLDSDNTLYLTGRLKRFIKVGGEMISLGAVEEALLTELKKSNKIATDVPVLAICFYENEVKSPKLYLFTTVPIDLDLTNQLLRDSGFSNLVKISKIELIREIPLMATGKIDYRKLQSQIKPEEAQ